MKGTVAPSASSLAVAPTWIGSQFQLSGDAFDVGDVDIQFGSSGHGWEKRWEAQSLLTRLGVWPGTTAESLRSDLATLDRLSARD
jgi:hypothetical protein